MYLRGIFPKHGTRLEVHDSSQPFGLLGAIALT